MTKKTDVAIKAFRSAVDATVLEPGDTYFAEARKRAVWNGDIDRQPALIVQPTTDAQVASALTNARHLGFDITVRGGGHGFAGNAVADGAVMIDLSGMATVQVDPVAKRARVGAGAKWEELDAATAPHNLAVTGGFISHTGVAGLTLGGGMGWLTRRAGLSCDNVVSFRMVTADGRVVTASATENHDLYWALRGGGGNFGIVTEIEYQLLELNAMANVGLFFWPVKEARRPLQFARDYVQQLPRDVAGFIAGLSAPPAPFVPANLQGTPGFAVVIVNWATPEEHATSIAPLRALNPAFELVTPMPYTALQQMFNESSQWGTLAYEKALYFDQLTDAVIDTAITFLPRKAAPLSFTPMFPLGGAFADVPDDATAFGGSRSSRWCFNIAALADTPELLAADRVWTKAFWEALLPNANSAATYINFLADEDEERIKVSYGPVKYARLAAIKGTWDPENVFHHNANIKPAGVPAHRTLHLDKPSPATVRA
jgi:FAD/FMN-containing dehydrogenase